MARARPATPVRPATPPTGRAQPVPKRPAATRPVVPQPPAGQPTPPSAVDPSVARLTAQVKALLSQWNGGDARTRVALGSVLEKVRVQLDHGQWLGWLEGTVPFTARSAQNYIELADWAEASPAVFERVAPLGASKVYLLSKLPLPMLDQMLAKTDHLVPGTKRKTTLGLMKYAEFMKLVLQQTRPAAPPTDPMVALLSDARSSAKKTAKLMKLLIANKQAIDHDAVEDLHDDLVVALQGLSSAFKLD
jgi:hypothetical protein